MNNEDLKNDIKEAIEEVKENVDEFIHDVKEEIRDELDEELGDKTPKEKPDDKAKGKNKKPSLTFYLLITQIILLGIIAFLWVNPIEPIEPKPTIDLITSLTNIVLKSDLSTFKANYTGVATKYNDKKNPDALYHVNYDVEVEASIDLSKIIISEEKENKKVIITLPKLMIEDPEITNNYEFEVMRVNWWYKNKDIALEEIVKLVLDDAKTELADTNVAQEFGKINAENIILSLTSPFVEMYDPEYTIEVKWGDQ